MKCVGLAASAAFVFFAFVMPVSAQSTDTSVSPTTGSNTSASSAAVATADAEPDPNEVICKSEAPTTGSLLGSQRMCKTRRQWKENDASTEAGEKVRHDMLSGAQGLPSAAGTPR
jgi:hypothetical protein